MPIAYKDNPTGNQDAKEITITIVRVSVQCPYCNSTDELDLPGSAVRYEFYKCWECESYFDVPNPAKK